MPPVNPSRRRQEDRTALSDQRLFDAAVSLLIEVGIQGMTLAAIGERAGYSRGLVTHRFGTKAGLLAQVHDRVAADWIQRVQQRVGGQVGLQALERMVEALYGFIAEEPDEIRAMYLLRYASIDPGSDYKANVAKVHKAQARDVRRWIEGGQKQGSIVAAVNAAATAELIVAVADGLIYRWLVNPQLPMRRLHELLSLEIERSLSATRL